MRFDGDVVQVDPKSLMTDVPGIFAGGDAVPSERTVTIGVGHGKKAARTIDAWLNSTSDNRPAKHPVVGSTTCTCGTSGTSPGAASPNSTPTRASGVRRGRRRPRPTSRPSFEAERCLSCGNCIECDGCLGACPEDAVIKLGKGHRYRYDYDKCTGCGTCYEQCPVHAIEMMPEGRPDRPLTGPGRGRATADDSRQGGLF
jgi:formate dehydrogenase beta subunit